MISPTMYYRERTSGRLYVEMRPYDEQRKSYALTPADAFGKEWRDMNTEGIMREFDVIPAHLLPPPVTPGPRLREVLVGNVVAELPNGRHGKLSITRTQWQTQDGTWDYLPVTGG
jgi:hypothetical protein